MARKRFDCLHENSLTLEGKMFKHIGGHVLESEIIHRLFALFFGVLSFRFPANVRLSGRWARHGTVWQAKQLNKQTKKKGSKSAQCLRECQRVVRFMVGEKKEKFATCFMQSFHCTAET